MGQHLRKRRLKKCSDGLIGIKIRSIFNDEHGLCGAKRIAATLKEGTTVGQINHKKVARIIKSPGTLKALANGVDALLPSVSLVTASCQI